MDSAMKVCLSEFVEQTADGRSPFFSNRLEQPPLHAFVLLCFSNSMEVLRCIV